MQYLKVYSIAGFEPPTSGLANGGATHICNMQSADYVLCKQSARHGQFQEMENSDYWIEHYTFEKKFDGKW